MQHEYELWLDESGSFIRDNENKINNNYHPSLVGGWLVKNSIKINDLNKYIVSESNGNNYHASGMSSSEKNKILQAIDYLKNKCKAETVFFINKELIDVNDNGELYLRIMASGLLQLLQELNAKGESVKLSVIIARRIDVSNMNKKVIENEEYKKTLNNYIKQKKAMKRITFSEDTEISFIVDTARKNVKLIMADYICNTKLTLSSRKFNDEERKKINKIISSGYQFSLTEDTSENIIKQSLVKGNISDALFELVTNPKSNFIKKI